MTGVDTAGGSFQESQPPHHITLPLARIPVKWQDLAQPLTPAFGPLISLPNHYPPSTHCSRYVTGEKKEFQESQWTFLSSG